MKAEANPYRAEFQPFDGHMENYRDAVSTFEQLESLQIHSRHQKEDTTRVVERDVIDAYELVRITLDLALREGRRLAREALPKL